MVVFLSKVEFFSRASRRRAGFSRARASGLGCTEQRGHRLTLAPALIGGASWATLRHPRVRYRRPMAMAEGLPVVTALHPLSEKALLRILTEPKNALAKQYERMFEMDGIRLSFEPSAFRAVVGEAVKRRTGARSLRSILEAVMLDIMYEAPTVADLEEVVITEKVVHRTGKPKYKYKAKKGKKTA